MTLLDRPTRALFAFALMVTASSTAVACGAVDTGAEPGTTGTETDLDHAEADVDEDHAAESAIPTDRPAFLEGHDLSTAQAEVAETFAAAVASLRASAGHRITFEGDVDGELLVGWADVDSETGHFHSYTESRGDSGPVVGAEYLLVGDEISARIGGNDGFEDLQWHVVDVGGRRDEFIDRTYTLGGVVAPGLDRIELLMRSVPFESQPLEGDNGYSVSFDSVDLAWFYLETGLERIASVAVPGQTHFDFRTDANGTLVQLAASGTVFHDGEPLPDVVAEIVYEVSATPKIIEPPS